jgi:predicted XRE-type DNA-binding protein
MTEFGRLLQAVQKKRITYLLRQEQEQQNKPVAEVVTITEPSVNDITIGGK